MASNSDINLTGRITQLEHQFVAMLDRLSRTEGTIEQLNKSIATGNRMTNWQFIGFVLVLAGTLFGTMYWSTSVMERRFDDVNQRFDDVHRRFDDVNRRIDHMHTDLNRRIDDLRQVVLSTD